MAHDAGRDPSGQALAASPSSPSVSPLTGFDPSRFERVVTFEPGYDRTNETPNHGRASMRIRFVLKGELGAVQFLIGTTWGPRSSDVSTHRLIAMQAMDPCRPSGWDVGYHSPHPLYEDQCSQKCDLLPGGECFYDGSGLRADEWVEDFVTGGDAWLWAKLEEEYRRLFLSSGTEARSDETEGLGPQDDGPARDSGDAGQ